MIFGVRCLFVLMVLSLLPLAVQAQGIGQDSLPSQRPAVVPPAQTGTGLVSPSIGNGTLQRQPRTGQIIDPRAQQPPIDARTPQLHQPETQLPMEHIEFQDFVARSTGRDLPIFGSELFKNVPSTFAPVDNIPVTSDYVIGPGDEILILAWGQIDVDYAAVVDRTGTINIPKVGTINVAGTKYQDLQSHLKTAIGRVFRNFDLTVSLGQLRAIQVFVVGQARRPGSYTVRLHEHFGQRRVRGGRPVGQRLDARHSTEARQQGGAY